ncbi:hypothetical protein SmJEL517_g04149 [Synchytrium microbalum]|uniref:Hemerythrin-like domain-containing protein n=1 Tax=Synchytrium microbalum TaxID=1806994 RepID=A0A507C5L8_9FUNG|nr:uncharacterized protein SmJEL517_g04149 [Synchytrium microbalum]TPX32843.1 hypothetical protein SmJEL517_g04149 [Synchytrium microbalum]
MSRKKRGHRNVINSILAYFPSLQSRLYAFLTAKHIELVNINTVKSLDLQPADNVLEIGFGRGDAIEICLQHARKGIVCGIDKSDMMVSVVKDRFAAQIQAGRVVIHEGTPESQLPSFEDQYFDSCFGVYVFWFLDDRLAALKEIARVLKTNGRLMFAVRCYGSNIFTRSASAEHVNPDSIMRDFEACGFDRVEFRFEAGWTISDTMYITAYKAILTWQELKSNVAGTPTTLPASAQDFKAQKLQKMSEDQPFDEVLAQDHAQILNYGKRYFALPKTDTDSRQNFLNTIIRALASHSLAEETVVYPAIEQNLSNGTNIATQLRQEHLELKKGLEAINSMQLSDANLDPILSKLLKEFEAHSKLEEATEFPALKQKLSTAQAIELGREFTKAWTMCSSRFGKTSAMLPTPILSETQASAQNTQASQQLQQMSGEEPFDQILARDHAQIISYFKNYMAIDKIDTENRQRHINSIVRSLSVHSLAEEMIIYPAMEKHILGGKTIAIQLRQEHLDLKKDLQVVDSLPLSDANLEPLLSKIMKDKLEESTEFPALRREISLIQAIELGREFMKAKSKAPTRPHPKAPDASGIMGKATSMAAGPIDKMRDGSRDFVWDV